MEHFSVAITSVDELKRYLGHSLVRSYEQRCRSVLVQVYSSSCDTAWIKLVVDVVRVFSDKAVIVGATTVGEICEGRVKVGTTVVSLSFFDESSLVPFSLSVTKGHEAQASQDLYDQIKQYNLGHIAGLLLLSTPLSVDCNVLLTSLHELAPGLALFGGGAGDYAGMTKTYVFDAQCCMEAGLVAVAFVGERLSIERYAFLGWKKVGKQMTVTKTDGFTVLEIDGQPAFNVYSRYLGVKQDEHFFLNALEFPLLVSRGDQVLARVPIAAHDDGSIQFIADINEGETVYLGYGDVALIMEEARLLQSKIQEFMPQAIYAYSCGCRRFLMQEDAELELLPLEAVASTSGFFTYGEFCDLGNQSPLLNSTIVVVAMREGSPRNEEDRLLFSDASEREDGVDPYRRRHTRVLSRFLYYLESVTQELTISNQHKSQFLSNMSHELRTPLNAVIGYTELVMEELQAKGGFESSVSDLGRVLDSSNLLLSLLGDVLDFTKIEAGKMELQLDDVNLMHVVNTVEQTLMPHMEKAGNKFTVHYSGGAKFLRIDEKKVVQVVLNLLNNAAKFTNQGQVDLTVNYHMSVLEFIVCDTGIGISNDQLETIFEEFHQVEMSTTRQYGGSGLGLAISLGLAKMMNGGIDVQSRFGEGSTFRFFFPCAEGSAP